MFFCSLLAPPKSPPRNPGKAPVITMDEYNPHQGTGGGKVSNVNITSTLFAMSKSLFICNKPILYYCTLLQCINTALFMIQTDLNIISTNIAL